MDLLPRRLIGVHDNGVTPTDSWDCPFVGVGEPFLIRGERIEDMMLVVDDGGYVVKSHRTSQSAWITICEVGTPTQRTRTFGGDRFSVTEIVWANLHEAVFADEHPVVVRRVLPLPPPAQRQQAVEELRRLERRLR